MPYLDGRPQVLFQQDNARPHIPGRTMKFLQDADVNIPQPVRRI